MTTLREAIEQTVAILGPEAPLCSGCVEEWTEALRILNDALAEQPAEQEPFKPDWDRVEALRESLREHMADVRQLRAALAWIASHKNSDWPERCQQIVDRARAALAEQPDVETCEIPPLGWHCTRHAGHEGPCAAVANDDRELVSRAMKRLAEQPAEQEPAAEIEVSPCAAGGVTAQVWSVELPVGTHKLYTAPQPAKRKRLTDEELRNALRSCPHDTVENLRVRWLYAKDFARAIERAHGITGETK